MILTVKTIYVIESPVDKSKWAIDLNVNGEIIMLDVPKTWTIDQINAKIKPSVKSAVKPYPDSWSIDV